MGVKQWVKPAFGAALNRSGLARLLEALPWPANGFVALTYHRLKPDPDLDDALLNVADLEAFDAQMAFLARRMRPISGDDLTAHLTGRRALPPRAVLVTFDDAYRDFLTDGWPIMKRHGVPATLFVPTAYPGGEIAGFWWDRLARALRRTPAGALDLPAGGAVRWDDAATRANALERLREVIETSHVAEAMALVDTWMRQLGAPPAGAPPAGGPPAGETAMCTWAELRALAAEGVTLGAHTRSHAILARLPLEAARAEIVGSRDDLAQQTGVTPRLFCYPNGKPGTFNDDTGRLLREAGFVGAFVTLRGFNRADGRDPMQLRRMSVSRRTSMGAFRMHLAPAVLQARERLGQL